MAMTPHEFDLRDRIQAWLGTAMMVLASVFSVLIFCDRMEMQIISLPVVWYSSRELHLIICGAMFVCAAILLRSSPRRTSQENRPLFRTCRLLTRKECHLCEDALATLLRFQDALPSIEIVEIDNEPQLVRQFGESVPVVEIDGQVRFRGAVHPLLLKRLIDAAELRETHPAAEPDDRQAPSSGITANSS